MDKHELNIYIGKPGSGEMCFDLVQNMYLLRAEIFNGRNQWGLPLNKGREIDEFDTLNTVYVICEDRYSGQVIGGWRLLPTTQEYMLNSVFPELLPASCNVQASDVWELSRFAVRKGIRNQSPFLASSITREMFAAVRFFADRQQVNRFVTVTSPSLYRLLSNSGLTMPRIDDLEESERRRLGRTSCYVEIDECFESFVSVGERSAYLKYSM
jgi:acyl homoserine lactone synthase